MVERIVKVMYENKPGLSSPVGNFLRMCTLCPSSTVGKVWTCVRTGMNLIPSGNFLALSSFQLHQKTWLTHFSMTRWCKRNIPGTVSWNDLGNFVLAVRSIRSRYTERVLDFTSVDSLKYELQLGPLELCISSKVLVHGTNQVRAIIRNNEYIEHVCRKGTACPAEGANKYLLCGLRTQNRSVSKGFPNDTKFWVDILSRHKLITSTILIGMHAPRGCVREEDVWEPLCAPIF
jgi:hypothetical protein